jgi:nanoRNase/pAp phosphatase (c-di-AMP/oligoRNAs hydrolase)
MHVMWGKKKQNVVFAVGKSIFNRTSKTNIGELMLLYGGGGHANAGTCQIDSDTADAVLQELIQKINAEG